MQYILFINNRLVQWKKVRNIIELAYEKYLPKHTKSWSYINLHVDPKDIDINVHPSKLDVLLLNEQIILDQIYEIIENTLILTHSSRNFTTKIINTIKNNDTTILSPSKLIRIDSTQSTLTNYIYQTKNFTTNTAIPHDEIEKETFIPDRNVVQIGQKLLETISISETIAVIPNDLLSKSILVGYIVPNYCLLQYATRLYLIDIKNISRHFFYLRILERLSQKKQWEILWLKDTIDITTSLNMISINDLNINDKKNLYIFLNKQIPTTIIDNTIEEDIGIQCRNILIYHNKFLRQNFGIWINTVDGTIASIPDLLPGYIPTNRNISYFILRLCLDIAWYDDISVIISTIISFLADLFAVSGDDSDTTFNIEEILREVLLPVFKRTHFIIPKVQSSSVIELTSCEELYRIFERC